MKPVTFNPSQTAALAQLELCMYTLKGAASGVASVGAKSVAVALVDAAKLLEKAHEAYITETQRTVAIAAPGDMQRALHDVVKP